jgi:hypothetical protein
LSEIDHMHVDTQMSPSEVVRRHERKEQADGAVTGGKAQRPPSRAEGLDCDGVGLDALTAVQ